MSALARPEDSVGSKTELSSQLLHDLRSPLTQIIGYSEMLAEDVDGQGVEGIAADLEKIRAAGKKLLALLETNFRGVHTLPSPRAVRDDETADDGLPESLTADRRTVLPGLLLVVDDDESNRDVLSRRLKHQGHAVVTASTGLDALRMLDENPFDVVLLDILMPNMDGYEVLGLIKADERLRHTAVIMISALDEVESVVRCIEAGADDYLTKPFNATLLKARIGACLEKKRGSDRESVLFEQLQQNYKRLQEAEKLRDDMRNMIVHDLRTPLTAVIMSVDLLGSHGALSDEQREMMTIAAGGGKTLLAMINDLLDVEKMESGATQLRYDELSAASMVAAAVLQVTSLAEEGKIALVSEIAPGLPAFSADANLLSRTLVNLIANAIKFTSAGTVTITAVLDGAATIRFDVRDTGDGIPAESLERIFEKFGQLNSRRVGTGLGLAFCKLAVEAHGGRIWVQSTPGVGSAFSFTIPVRARE